MKIRSHPAHSNPTNKGSGLIERRGVERTSEGSLILRSLYGNVQRPICPLSSAVVSGCTLLRIFLSLKLSVNVPTTLDHRHTVSGTQQAGWPRPAYPSRLTLRIV